MYNILVTDDEQIVIDSLSFIINKNFTDINVFTAHSGTEALEIAMKENIDIIFMDINMPGLSGLETASCIKKMKPNIVINILSAFDRFQYAQEAMNLGSFKYITKPVNRNLLIETIKESIEVVDSHRGKLSADTELHKKLDLVSPMIENDFIYACIFNNENADLSSYLDYFNLTGTSWIFCCFEFPNINSTNQMNVYAKIHELLNAEHKCLVSSFMMNRIVVFYPVYSQEKDYENLKTAVKQIYTQLSYNISSGIRCGVSQIESDISKLQESYNEALSNLNKVSSTGGLNFTGQEQEVFQTAKSNKAELKNQIITKIKLGDTNNVKLFTDLFASDLLNSNVDLNKYKNSMLELLITAHNTAEQIVSIPENDSYDNAFSFMSQENNTSLLKDFVQNLLTEYSQLVANSKTSEENPLITKVCDYLDNNLKEDISLEQMANIINVSPFYLSKLFKEEKGITFINFISDKRLEKARDLLEHSDLSIKEITSEIGYNDQNYFSRIFKNKFGLSPKEYRKSN